MKCDAGGAITSVWNSCDGFQDCADNSDEDKCGKGLVIKGLITLCVVSLAFFILAFMIPTCWYPKRK